jgi:hypothetical protein
MHSLLFDTSLNIPQLIYKAAKFSSSVKQSACYYLVEWRVVRHNLVQHQLVKLRLISPYATFPISIEVEKV